MFARSPYPAHAKLRKRWSRLYIRERKRQDSVRVTLSQLVNIHEQIKRLLWSKQRHVLLLFAYYRRINLFTVCRRYALKWIYSFGIANRKLLGNNWWVIEATPVPNIVIILLGSKWNLGLHDWIYVAAWQHTWINRFNNITAALRIWEGLVCSSPNHNTNKPVNCSD